MGLKTTVVGAWPKPDDLDLPDWFSEKGNFESGIASNLTGMGGGFDPRSILNAVAEREQEFHEKIGKAAKEVIGEQVSLGIDVVTDGEVDRGTYYMHIMKNIQGIDMLKLGEKEMRSGSYSTLVPVVRSKVEILEPMCFKEWQRSQALTPEGTVLKYTIPGPMTLTDGILNEFYDNISELQDDLVAALNKEILSLVKNGCKVIQIDEPVMMRYPEKALEYGIKNLTKCLENVPEDVTKVVHLCCGYPDKLDTDEYPKAPKENYRLLAGHLDAAGFDEISIEDAEARNDLSVLSLFKNSKIILGSVTIARSKLETVEEIKKRVEEALLYIPKERLVLAPDCGLGFLPVGLVRAKLANMVEAAKSF